MGDALQKIPILLWVKSNQVMVIIILHISIIVLFWLYENIKEGIDVPIMRILISP